MANTPISPATLARFAAAAKVIEETTGALTVRACMAAWGYNSTSATRYAMRRLVEAGYVTEFPRGIDGHTYRVNNLEAIQ
jgi:hypothetical protein